MQNAETLRKHASLVDRMADHVGVDLEESVMRGALAPDVIPDLVLRCTKCSNPEACARLLRATQSLAEAPEYCVNRDTLAKLATRAD
ncbi:DUF6455 family protein [Tropicimonas sp. S265A]|uniref:DUF6455 family protein n=1 Tax=Tropicimonas sp. S265A TaxID=3415134 RepID=UPI003C7E1445